MGAAAPGVRPGFGVSISDVPASGDPYLIEFNVTVASGTPTGYNWSFGDGQYWNGSGPGFAAPAHRYPGPGNFTVAVTVAEGSLTSAQTLPLTLVRAPLRVQIVTHPVLSPDGRTVAFNASVGGGTGDYPSVLWRFGDGGTGSGLSIRYTYRDPGQYPVTVTVTDSSGFASNATASVRVTGAAATAPSNGIGPWVPLLVLAAATGVLVVAVLFTRWYDRRSLERDSIEEPIAPSPAPPVVPPEPTPPPELPAEPAVPEALPPKFEPEPVPAEPAVPVPPPPSEPEPAHPEVKPESLRTSQRIVIHLAGLGSLSADEVAPLGFSQRGIAEALSVSQNALTNVLRRLVAGGVLTEDVRHVRGQPRRLKVYRLTGRGEALARDLRRTHRPGRPDERADPRSLGPGVGGPD